MYFKRYFPLALLLLAMVSGCAPAPDEVVQEATAILPEEVSPDLQTQEEEEAVVPFTLAIYDEYTIDPAWADHRANLTLTPLLYEGLFQLDNSFSPQPLLCTSYTTSADGLVWTFTLRSGVTFSDGTPLTGELAAASLKASAATGSRYASRLSSISKFQGDETTVTLTLTTPNTGLAALLDVPITLSQEDSLHPLGTGAYTYADDGSALLARSDYWQTTAIQTVDIPLHPIRYTDDLVSAFDAGYVSLVDVDLMGTQAPYFSTSYQLWSYPTTSMVYLGFNFQADKYTGKSLSPCASLQLRQVVSMAVDRSTIVNQYYAQQAVASTLPLHPYSSLYDVILATTGDYSDAMLAAAVAELSSTDYTLTLVTANENAARLATAQSIVDTLNGAGIATQLVSLSWDDYVAALEDGDFDIYLAETQLTADFDITPLIQSDGALNYGDYTSPTTDELLLSFRSASTPGQTTAASRLYSHILEQAPIVPICFRNNTVLTQWGRISQLTPTQSNAFYQMTGWIFSDEAETP